MLYEFIIPCSITNINTVHTFSVGDVVRVNNVNVDMGREEVVVYAWQDEQEYHIPIQSFVFCTRLYGGV